MIQNSLRLALRRLGRQKGYTALNVLGLAVGLAVCGVIMLFVRHETSYDAFHEHADRIHLLLHEQVERGEVAITDRIPHPVGDAVRETVPGAEQVVQIRWGSELRVVSDGEVTYLNDLYHAGPEVFEVFTLPLLAGDPATSLLEPNSVVIDARLAGSLFGEQAWDQVIGRTITNEVDWEGETYRSEYTVTGVMATVPATTHWRPRGLVSMSTIPNPEVYRPATYLLTRAGTSVTGLDRLDPAEMGAMRRVGLGSGEFFTQPIRDVHLHGTGGREAAGPAPITRLRVFVGVALLILLLAGVNYVSLATALGLTRARESGVRKTLGATGWQIGVQTLVESVLLALAAAVVALALIAVALPYFADAIQVPLELPIAEAPLLAVLFLILAGGVGLLAGTYPAAVLSGAQPAAAFRSGAPSGFAGARVRRVLVLFQIGAFVVLIVASQVMSRQLAFVQDHDIGIQPDQVLVIDTRYAQDRNPLLRDLLEQHPAVLMTATGSISSTAASRNHIPIPGADDADAEIAVVGFLVSPEFPQAVGARLHPVQLPVPERLDEDEVALYLSVSMVHALGWAPEEAAGRELHGRRVLGVFDDFHYASLRSPLEPMMLHVSSEWPSSRVLVRFPAGETRAVLEAAESAWREVAGGDPLNAYFLDDQFAALYDAERRMADLFGIFAGLSVFVAALGLVGLAAFTAQRRRREVGIRKVVGASVGSITGLLTKDFLKLVGLAFLIAAPVAYWVMSRWLEGFAYRITLGPEIFLAAAASAVAVTLLAVGYHAVRAATADPVEAIRAE